MAATHLTFEQKVMFECAEARRLSGDAMPPNEWVGRQIIVIPFSDDVLLMSRVGDPTNFDYDPPEPDADTPTIVEK